VHTAGLDALIFHRACAFGVIFFLPVTVLASAVRARPAAVRAAAPWAAPHACPSAAHGGLEREADAGAAVIPLYATGGRGTVGVTTSLSQLTMAHLPPGSALYWCAPGRHARLGRARDTEPPHAARAQGAGRPAQSLRASRAEGDGRPTPSCTARVTGARARLWPRAPRRARPALCRSRRAGSRGRSCTWSWRTAAGCSSASTRRAAPCGPCRAVPQPLRAVRGALLTRPNQTP